MKKLMKQLGYGISIHYNEYSGKFQVYDKTYTVKMVEKKNPKKAIKEYIEKYK